MKLRELIQGLEGDKEKEVQLFADLLLPGALSRQDIVDFLFDEKNENFNLGNINLFFNAYFKNNSLFLRILNWCHTGIVTVNEPVNSYLKVLHNYSRSKLKKIINFNTVENFQQFPLIVQALAYYANGMEIISNSNYLKTIQAYDDKNKLSTIPKIDEQYEKFATANFDAAINIKPDFSEAYQARANFLIKFLEDDLKISEKTVLNTYPLSTQLQYLRSAAENSYDAQKYSSEGITAKLFTLFNGVIKVVEPFPMTGMAAGRKYKNMVFSEICYGEGEAKVIQPRQKELNEKNDKIKHKLNRKKNRVSSLDVALSDAPILNLPEDIILNEICKKHLDMVDLNYLGHTNHYFFNLIFKGKNFKKQKVLAELQQACCDKHIELTDKDIQALFHLPLKILKVLLTCAKLVDTPFHANDASFAWFFSEKNNIIHDENEIFWRLVTQLQLLNIGFPANQLNNILNLNSGLISFHDLANWIYFSENKQNLIVNKIDKLLQVIHEKGFRFDIALSYYGIPLLPYTYYLQPLRGANKSWRLFHTDRLGRPSEIHQ